MKLQPPRGADRVVDRFAPLFFLLLGILLLSWRPLMEGALLYGSHIGDSRFNHFLLEHSYRVVRGELSFWNPPFFYPLENGLAFSDVLVSVAPPYWVFRALGITPITSFELWALCHAAITFFLSFLLIRKLISTSSLASSCGAFLVTFGATRTAQLGHVQLWPHAYWLLSLLFIYGALTSAAEHRAKRQLSIVGAGLAVVAQFYGGFYFGWFAALAMFLGGLAALLHPPSRRFLVSFCRDEWLLGSLTALLCLILLLPLAHRYLLASSLVGTRDFNSVYHILPRLSSFAVHGETHFLYHFIRPANVAFRHEKQLGVGFVTPLVAVIGMFFLRKKSWFWVVLSTSVAIASLVVLLPATEQSLWRFARYLLPGAEAIRAPGRGIILLLLPLGLGVAAVLQVVNQRQGWGGKILLALVLSFVVLEQVRVFPTNGKRQAMATAQMIADKLEASERQCEAFVLTNLRGRFEYFKYHLDAMWASLITGIPTLNGYSGNFPPAWPLAQPNAASKKRERQVVADTLEWTQRLGVDPERVCWVRRGKGRRGKVELARINPRHADS